MNPQYFGFTGTPRFSINKSLDGRTTADIFGKCLHKYLLKDAINDKNVLGFSVDYYKTIDSNLDNVLYDEEVEGVKFEDLPEDWVCPLCGVGKEMFKKVEE